MYEDGDAGNPVDRTRVPLMKTWWDGVKGDVESCGLSHEDAEDRNHWRLIIKWEPAYPDLSEKLPLVCIL